MVSLQFEIFIKKYGVSYKEESRSYSLNKKIKMKKLSILFLALVSVAFYSCKDNQKTTEPEVVTVDNTTDEVEVYAVKGGDAEFNNPDIAAVFNQYIQLQNALINTNPKDAAREATRLHQIMNEMDVNADENILGVVSAMSETEDVKLQREKFETLNDWMEVQVEGALKSGTIYKQYCPMAFSDQGAYWLSTDKEVLNPYFGDVMLHCGRVDAEIN